MLRSPSEDMSPQPATHDRAVTLNQNAGLRRYDDFMEALSQIVDLECVVNKLSCDGSEARLGSDVTLCFADDGDVLRDRGHEGLTLYDPAVRKSRTRRRSRDSNPRRPDRR